MPHYEGSMLCPSCAAAASLVKLPGKCLVGSLHQDLMCKWAMSILSSPDMLQGVSCPTWTRGHATIYHVCAPADPLQTACLLACLAACLRVYCLSGSLPVHSSSDKHVQLTHWSCSNLPRGVTRRPTFQSACMRSLCASPCVSQLLYKSETSLDYLMPDLTWTVCVSQGLLVIVWS